MAVAPDRRHGHGALLAFLGQFVFQRFEAHAWRAAGEPAAGEVMVLKILDMAQDRLARVEALGAAGLLGERSEAVFDVEGKAQGQHGKLLQVLYMYSVGRALASLM